MDKYGFYIGDILDAYTYLGAHYEDGKTTFRTFAPNAQKVSLLLNDQEIEMPSIYDGNFYEVSVDGAKPGDLYEYRIYKRNGEFTDHCDPYGFGMEKRPAHKSIVEDLAAYQFNDHKWMKKRADTKERPLNIYEMHMGSWRKPENGEWYRYDELAGQLIPYLKESGFNCVEFLPLSEHPCDESWGYQNTGFFAPTSRYGSPDDLKKLIDELHQNDIAVILDFVPVHFAVDPYGLAQYDGSALYEYPHRDVGVSEWGSYNFMHSRGEVRSFLQSAANYWLKEFHFDGLRMDAISRIIYWQGDEKRGVNGNAVDFIKVMNKGLKANNPGCVLIAEDSTNFDGVTRPVEQGGLGFDYKWDMGWMHDTLDYFQADPSQRPELYHKLTFSMMYFPNENYLLPFSHDEVVHGKDTILQKMNGEYEKKFPQARAMYLYMMTHPGKKLNFMGNEIGQLREWDEKRQQDWELRKYPIHDGFYHYMQRLNHLYLENPALWAWDYKPEGFQWLDCHQESRSLYAIERRSGSQRIAAIFNFSSQPQENYEVKIPGAQSITPLLYSDWQNFGGSTPEGQVSCSLDKDTLTCSLAPFSALLVEIQPGTMPEQPAKTEPDAKAA